MSAGEFIHRAVLRPTQVDVHANGSHEVDASARILDQYDPVSALGVITNGQFTLLTRSLARHLCCALSPMTRRPESLREG